MSGFYNSHVMQKFISAIRRMDGEELHVKFSGGNSKMGAVPSVSLLPFLTCPVRCKDTCGPACYAAKLANLRPSVLNSYANNTVLAIRDMDRYFEEIRDFCRAQRFFRFHVSGDIINNQYFEGMLWTANENPHCEFLAFTKRFEIVNEYAELLPENLHILFSGWTNLEPINPYKFPETNIFTEENPPKENWTICGGNCFECACRGTGCWTIQKGETIAFHKH